MTAIQKLAAEYRTEVGRQGGYVVIYDNKPGGWTLELNKPGGWMPGCIAIDEQGKQWEAQGGDDYSGAHSWTPIADEKQR